MNEGNEKTDIDSMSGLGSGGLRGPDFLLMSLGLFWLGLLFSFVFSEPVRFADSPGYLTGDVRLMAEAGRAWPTVLIFSLAPTDEGRVAIQLVLYGLAGSGLIAVASSSLRTRVGLFLNISIVVLLLTPLFLGWNFAILAESVSSSLLLGAVALALHGFKCHLGDSDHSVTFLGLAALLSSLAAVNRIPLVVFTFVVIALMLWVASSRFRWSLRTGIAVLAALILFLYPLYYVSGSETDYESLPLEAAGRNPPETSSSTNRDDPKSLSRYGLTFFILSAKDSANTDDRFADQLWDSVVDAAGPCIRAFRARNSIPPSPYASEDFDLGYRGPYEAGRDAFANVPSLLTTCPEEVRWLNSEFPKHYLSFLVSHPRLVLEQTIWSLRGLTLSGVSSYAPVYSILPAPLELVFEGSIGENSISLPFFGWLFLSFAMVLLVTVRRRPSSTLWVSVVLALGALGAIIVSNLMMVGDSVRIANPAIVTSYVLFLIIIATCVASLSRTDGK